MILLSAARGDRHRAGAGAEAPPRRRAALARRLRVRHHEGAPHQDGLGRRRGEEVGGGQVLGQGGQGDEGAVGKGER